MEYDTDSTTGSVTQFSRSTIVWVTLCCIVLLLVAGHTVSAGPQLQTIPPATSEPTATPVPQATATPAPDRDGDSGDDGNNDSAPPAEPTVTPANEAAATNEPTTPTTSALAGAVTGTVTANRLNVRSGPGVDFAVIGTVLAGEELSILGRNVDRSWWRICCVSGATTEGWVSAAYVALDLAISEADVLVPLVEGGAATVAVAPTTTVTATAVASAASAIAGVSVPTTTLELNIAQTPPFVWQGQEAEFSLTVVNRGDSPAFAVTIRDELPSTVTYLDGTASESGDVTREDASAGGVAFTVSWPELAAGATVTANIRVRIDDDVADGTVLDNLAVVSAKNAAQSTEGISIEMPPTSLPAFQ